MQAGGLVACAEERDRAERVGADEDPPLRPPERHLLPPAAPKHRAGTGTASPAATSGRRGAARRVAPPARRRRGCAGRAAGSRRPARRARGRAPRRRRRRSGRSARRGRRRRARATCVACRSSRSTRSRRRARRRSGCSRRSSSCANACSNTSCGCAPSTSSRRSSRKAGTRVGADRTRLPGRGDDAVAVAVAAEHVLDVVRRELELGGEPRAARRGRRCPAPRAQYASISRSCTASCRPRSRASSVSCSARIEFGTTSGCGL